MDTWLQPSVDGKKTWFFTKSDIKNIGNDRAKYPSPLPLPTCIVCHIGMMDLYEILFTNIRARANSFVNLTRLSMLIPTEFDLNQDNFREYVLKSINSKFNKTYNWQCVATVAALKNTRSVSCIILFFCLLNNWYFEILYI